MPRSPLSGAVNFYVTRPSLRKHRVLIQNIGTALAVLTAVTSASTFRACAFDRVVVLGDSLSANGNAGRFSNGPNWVEQLAKRLGVSLRPSQSGGTNFAIGGARLDDLSGPNSLSAQADRHLSGPDSTGRTLHVVYGGGNDLLG